MKTLAVLALILCPAAALAQAPEVYTATPHGRLLACHAEAYSLVELLDVATKNLVLLAGETTKDATPARVQVVAGMMASGTLVDQQQALDVAERLDQCVVTATDRATPDAAAAFVAGALRQEIIVAINMADGFASDVRQSADVMNKFLTAGRDPALQAATNGALARFGTSVRATLDRVRLSVDRLVERSAAR